MVYSKRSSRHKGFTLIELLVVIAIIGILSGISLTLLNSARNKAKLVRTHADMNEMAKALEMASLDGCLDVRMVKGEPMKCTNPASNKKVYMVKVPTEPLAFLNYGFTLYNLSDSKYRLSVKGYTDKGILVCKEAGRCVCYNTLNNQGVVETAVISTSKCRK